MTDIDPSLGQHPSDVLAAAPGALRRVVASELRTQWALVVIAAAATLVGSAAIAVGPSMVRKAIDDGLEGGDRGALQIAVIVYLAALVAGGIAGGVRTTVMTTAAERSIHRLRVDSLTGLFRLELGRFERLRRGDLLARVTADTEELSGAARYVIPDLIRHTTDLAAAIIAVAVLEPTLALLTLVAAPPMAMAGRALRRRSAIVYPRYRTEIGTLIGEVSETVEGADTVLAHGRRSDRLDRLRAGNHRVTARYLDGTDMRNRFYASITLTRVTSTSVVLIAASLLAADGKITVGTAAAGVLAVSTVFGPLAWLTELLDDAFSAKAALDRVVAASVVTELSGADQRLPDRGDLVFDHVSFEYRPGRPVLTNVDITIAAGSRIAIVGTTGAGKSTLARLAAGLAAPTRGRVCFGNVDLREASHEDRRRRLFFVLQESFCFRGSLAENLRIVAPTATDAELHDAVLAAGLVDWVRSHPDGLDRAVGTNGSQLSAGERQLIGVLRLAVADPAVVILDEATAILDPATDALVGAALDRSLQGRTVITIAHRPETAARSDVCVRIRDGSAHLEPIATEP